jgi:hypothetical protein
VLYNASRPADLVRKKKWTDDEDRLLTESVASLGTMNWTLVAEALPCRTGKQCRERWVNQICPSLSPETWTFAEDQLLLHHHRICGNAWAHISVYLPGRSPNAVKNRWVWLKNHPCGWRQVFPALRMEVNRSVTLARPSEPEPRQSPERLLFAPLEERVIPFPTLRHSPEPDEEAQQLTSIDFID